MNLLFADTAYWVAILNPRDALAPSVRRLRMRIEAGRLVTTQVVFMELLAFFSAEGSRMRAVAAQAIRETLDDAAVAVVSASDQQFRAGLQLYESRPDKGYSLVDCISMTVMREMGITSALTADRHFEQERFEILLK